MVRPHIPDVLADRYASTAMLQIWSPEAKIILERQLWIAVMKAQQQLGLPNITEEAIAAYESFVENIDLDSLRERELVTRHDVKAKIEEFNYLAGHQLVHLGMTSRDLTENVEQLQMKRSLDLIHFKVTAVLVRLNHRAFQYLETPLTGRSHNVAAQMVTLGKRFSNSAEELLRICLRIDQCGQHYPLRGMKGPVGTQQDMLELLGNDQKVSDLERLIAEHLGFKRTCVSVGQVYPRSLDFEILSLLTQVAQTGSSFATTLRLMAGQELVTEGFKEGQVGSSAMPHKMNARSSERICGFYNVIRGFLTMIEGPAGDQWNEGDVSCSVVRRVALPGAFFAIDGLLETWLTVLDEFGAYPAVIEREITRYLPFLATTKILMTAVKAGMGREAAHKCIKKHAVQAALAMREDGESENLLLESLADDPEFVLNIEQLNECIGAPLSFSGLAIEQVERMGLIISAFTSQHQEAVNYRPERIL